MVNVRAPFSHKNCSCSESRFMPLSLFGFSRVYIQMITTKLDKDKRATTRVGVLAVLCHTYDLWNWRVFGDSFKSKRENSNCGNEKEDAYMILIHLQSRALIHKYTRAHAFG